MGGQFQVDTEKIRFQKSKLDKWITECQKLKTKKCDVTSIGKGPVVDEIEGINDTLQMTVDSLLALMENTSEYLGKISSVYDTSDEKQANELGSK